MEKELICDKTNILGHIETKDDDKKDIVIYAFIDDVVIKEKDEVKRTNNSYTIKTGKNTFRARLFTYHKFYKKDDKWFNVKRERILKEDWEKENDNR